MDNQTVGITTVFALTFVLFVVRHFILTVGRRRRKPRPGLDNSPAKVVQQPALRQARLRYEPDGEKSGVNGVISRQFAETSAVADYRRFRS